MKCKFRLGEHVCQLSMMPCEGEDNCTHYQLEAERLCPNCNKRGAGWSGYGKPGGLDYTCWHCEHVWNEPLVWLKTPGVCLRCGREFSDPVPEVTYPNGNHEIASNEWCADCNALCMSVLLRESSAYKTASKIIYDPMKGGRHADT